MDGLLVIGAICIVICIFMAISTFLWRDEIAFYAKNKPKAPVCICEVVKP